MRTIHSIRNILLTTGLTLVSALTGFVSRTVFIKILGSEYLGINGVMANVFTMLSIAEMGMATAIGFSLYKPLADQDAGRVSALMSFYKRAYRVIAAIVAVAGLLVLPLLSGLIKSPQPIPHLHLMYLILLINTVAGYFLTYPQTLINADQKAYRIIPFSIAFNLVWFAAQLATLALTRNYIAYLLTQLVVLIVQQIVTNRYVRECYPWVDFNSKAKLPAGDLACIKTTVGAMLWHKLGDFCVNGTINLIISARLSVALVGLYSNYVLLIGMIKSLLLLMLNGVTPSFGNLICTGTPAKCLEKARMLDFLAFWLFGWTAICFYMMINPFIVCWIGPEYLFNKTIVALILLDYYLTGSRIPLFVVKAAGGLYAQDKYVPFFQAVVNLGVSLWLASYLGVAGVLIGMMISTYIFPFWYRAAIVYRHVFQSPVRDYYFRYALYLGVVMLGATLTAALGSCIRGHGWSAFALRGILSLVVPNGVILLLFWRSMEMKQLISVGRGLLSERMKCFQTSA